ncbi:unnamed protein product [Owenia fusiformis]|uniref:Uncharacterized protein n=1 Tax=Owenia fusiformis TaxID=6347 RepID=A0A8J1TKJ9_OWEFU|nr:unnamed protein product [Owenia fusiformis]
MKCGLIKSTNQEEVPLKNISVNVEIQGFVSNTESTLLYENSSDETFEATFFFPLDDQSAVYNFEAEIEGRIIVAECQEIEQAKKTYEDAIQAGRSAFILEEDRNTGDIFKCTVGNVPAKTDVKIKLSYVSDLTIEADKSVKYVLPIVLNPRYSPEGSAQNTEKPNDAINFTKGSEIPYSLECAVHLTSDYVINDVKANKYDVNVEYEDNEKKRAKATLRESFKFDCDLTFLVFYDLTFEPHMVLEQGSKDKDGYLSQDVVMLNFYPELKDVEFSGNAEYIFVVDRSGSMGGKRIIQAKETLHLFLKSLPVGSYYNIVSFGSSYKTLFKKSQEYSKSSLDEGLQLQKSMGADLGGTEILAPFKWIYEQDILPGYPRQIFLLTDGSVWNTDEVIKLVKDNVNTTRVFTFGIGDGASTSLVKGLADAGKGKSEFVTGSDNLRAKVMSSLKCSMQPSISDLDLQWNLPKGVSAVKIPKQFPPVFADEKFVVYALLQNMPSIIEPNYGAVLTGTSGQRNLEYHLHFPTTHTSSMSLTLHRLAAKLQIKELQNEKPTEDLNADALKNHVVLMSVSANVVSRHTAFVGVDKQNKEAIKISKVYNIGSTSDQVGMGLYSRQMMCMSAPMMCMSAPMPARRKVASAQCPQMNIRKKSRGKAKMKKLAAPPPPAPETAEIMELCDADEDEDVGVVAELGSCDGPAVAAAVSASQNSGGRERTAMAMVKLQTFNGSWLLESTLAHLIGKSLDDLKKHLGVQFQSAEILATVLALAWLRKYCMESFAEWEMIESKAEKWLQGESLNGKSVNELINLAAKEV